MGRGVKTPPNKYSTVGIALNTTWTISPEICKKVYSSYHRSQRNFRTVLKLYVGYFYHIFLFYKRKNLTWADRFLAFGKLFVEKFSFSIISQFFPDPPHSRLRQLCVGSDLIPPPPRPYRCVYRVKPNNTCSRDGWRVTLRGLTAKCRINSSRIFRLYFS